MKYYIIAGEASGDLHGANLMKALISEDQDANIRYWGGDLMSKIGGTLIKHYKDLAFMGFVEVLFNLKTIFKNITFCKNDIVKFNPDVVIFIDYPGFNMRIAKWAKKKGIKTHYYISPQIWAWKESRIKAIKRDVDQMYVILPFEKTFYEDKHQFPVHFVGHPLIDEISNRTQEEKQKNPGDAEAVEGMGSISSHKGEHLMPTDKGVMIYRRRIRKLSKDLEEGKDPPQPQKAKGQVVRTNGQDTILKAPKKKNNDKEYVKSICSSVINMQFDLEDMPLKERDNNIIKNLRQMETRGSFD